MSRGCAATEREERVDDRPQATGGDTEDSGSGDTPDGPASSGTAAERPGVPSPHPHRPLPWTSATPEPPRQRRPALTALRVFVALLSVLALAATGTGWVTLNWFQTNTNTTDVLSELGRQSGGPSADDGATDILLIGSDSRTDMQGTPLPGDVLKQLRTTADSGVNTDTIIVLRIPKNGGRAYAVSIPRDTYVSVPGLGMNKINAAFQLTKVATEEKLQAGGERDRNKLATESEQAGRKALVGAVQDLTGAHIDHYAEINLYGFYLLSQAIGGVQVCLRQATSDTDSGANFAKGVQTISGSTALSFVRQRKNLPDGDLSRIVRQQVFLASAAKKLLSAGTLTDTTKLGSLVDTAHKSLLVDPGLDLLNFLQQAQSLASGNVTFVTIPVTDINGRSPNGQSIVTVDPPKVRDFVHGLALGRSAPTPMPAPAPAPTSGTVSPATMAPAAAHGNPPTDADSGPVTIDGQRCVY